MLELIGITIKVGENSFNLSRYDNTPTLSFLNGIFYSDTRPIGCQLQGVDNILSYVNENFPRRKLILVIDWLNANLSLDNPIPLPEKTITIPSWVSDMFKDTNDVNYDSKLRILNDLMVSAGIDQEDRVEISVRLITRLFDTPITVRQPYGWDIFGEPNPDNVTYIVTLDGKVYTV